MVGGEHFIDPRSSLRQAITSNSTKDKMVQSNVEDHGVVKKKAAPILCENKIK
jgi:hypothetical protein